MKFNKKIAVPILIAALIIGIVAIILLSGGNSDKPKEPEILPDVLMPKNTSYITEKTDTSITVEGYITTPAEENPVPDSLDDPDFVYPDEIITYIYKSHSHSFDEYGNMFIEIEYEKTTDMAVSTEFSITVEDEKLAESPAVFITCNGYEHKVWQA